MTLERLLEDQIIALIEAQIPSAVVLPDVGDMETPLPKITVKARNEQFTELRTAGVERIAVEVTSHVEIPEDNWRAFTQMADDAIETVLMSQTAASDVTTTEIICDGHIQGDADRTRDDRRVMRTRNAVYFVRFA
jgi:hypothetical protein